jgi:hypothetical protein
MSTSSSLWLVTSTSFLVGYADVFHCMFDASFADPTESSMIDRPWLLCPKVCFLRHPDKTCQATAAFAYKTKFLPLPLLKTFLIPKSSVKVFLTVPLYAYSSSALIYTVNRLSVSFGVSSSFDVFHLFPTLFTSSLCHLETFNVFIK